MKKMLLAAAAVIALGASAHGTELKLKSCSGFFSTVKEYGNGSYYFSCGDFGYVLSELRTLYPRYIISFSSHNGLEGGTSGYYVMLNPPPKAE